MSNNSIVKFDNDNQNITIAPNGVEPVTLRKGDVMKSLKNGARVFVGQKELKDSYGLSAAQARRACAEIRNTLGKELTAQTMAEVSRRDLVTTKIRALPRGGYDIRVEPKAEEKGGVGRASKKPTTEEACAALGITPEQLQMLKAMATVEA